MEIDPAQLEPRDNYRHLINCISPRPIAWVATRSRLGVDNLAPFSFFMGVGAKPMSIAFSIANHPDGRQKDTLVNIEETGCFVVNIVTEELVEPMNLSSAELPPEMDEFAFAKVERVPARLVAAYRVQNSPIQLECEKFQIVQVGSGPLAANLVIGKVMLIHVADDVAGASGIDQSKISFVGRLGGQEYSRCTDRFTLKRPAK